MLVEEHVGAIFRLAAAIVGRADAADVTQETFVAAWQQLPRLRDPDKFTPWLRRICVNRSRNWLRAAKSHVPLGAGDGAPEGAEPGDFAVAVETRAVLDKAFDALHAEHRAVLALHYSLGYSLAETAEILGLPSGTVKSRLNAALRAMRREASSKESVPRRRHRE